MDHENDHFCNGTVWALDYDMTVCFDFVLCRCEAVDRKEIQ